MEVRRIGSRGYLFTFDDLVGSDYDCTTNVYVIDGRENIFVCDTFLGPDSAQEIKTYLRDNLAPKPFIIFNSHADWDHIWGNAAFGSQLVVAHQLCRQRLKADGEAELRKHAQYQRGHVQLLLPNLTFQERLGFPEEGIDFIYSPGHTIDSASCYDRVDRVVFVGDNVEDPIPYVTPELLNAHEATLENYLQWNARTIIPAHGPLATRELIRQNLQYLKRLKNSEEEQCPTEKYRFIHNCNLQALQKVLS